MLAASPLRGRAGPHASSRLSRLLAMPFGHVALGASGGQPSVAAPRGGTSGHSPARPGAHFPPRCRRVQPAGPRGVACDGPLPNAQWAVARNASAAGRSSGSATADRPAAPNPSLVHAIQSALAFPSARTALVAGGPPLSHNSPQPTVSRAPALAHSGWTTTMRHGLRPPASPQPGPATGAVLRPSHTPSHLSHGLG